MRVLTHILIALTVVLSTLSGLPCECIAAGVSHTAAEVAEAAGPAEAGHGCCAGNVHADEPEQPEHDCPHCLSGSCDVDAADASRSALLVDNRNPNEYPAPATTAWVNGAPTWPLETLSALEIALPPPPCVSMSGWDRCVRNQVIRR